MKTATNGRTVPMDVACARVARGVIAVGVMANAGESVAVDYQPGNMTRYRVLWVSAPTLFRDGWGSRERTYGMLSVLGFGGVMVDPSGHWSQLTELRGLGEADWHVLWDLVLHLNGLPLEVDWPENLPFGDHQ